MVSRLVFFFPAITQKCPIVTIFVIMADVRTALHAYPVPVFVARLRTKLRVCSSCGSWRTVFEQKTEGKCLGALILIL